MNDSEAALAEELERARDDEGEWAEEAVDVKVRSTRTQVVSFRLPLDELERLTTCAAATGESLSEFVRGAIELRIGQTMSPFITLSHSMKSVTVYDSPASSGWTEAAPGYSSVIDEPGEATG